MATWDGNLGWQPARLAPRPSALGRSIPLVAATFTRTRRRRKPPQRLGPHLAGSEAAIRIVRGYIEQQQRIARGRDELSHAMRALEQPSR